MRYQDGVGSDMGEGGGGGGWKSHNMHGHPKQFYSRRAIVTP